MFPLTKTTLSSVDKVSIRQKKPEKPEIKLTLKPLCIDGKPFIAESYSNPDPHAAIKAKLCKLLREETGAGLMDCKKALIETDWGFFKAIDWLKENYQPIHSLNKED